MQSRDRRVKMQAYRQRCERRVRVADRLGVGRRWLVEWAIHRAESTVRFQPIP